jgi:hypothetical protein
MKRRPGNLRDRPKSMPAAPSRSLEHIAATITRHFVPLLSLAVLGGEPVVYLALLLFDLDLGVDLGAGHVGPRLLSQGALTTREFV